MQGNWPLLLTVGIEKKKRYLWISQTEKTAQMEREEEEIGCRDVHHAFAKMCGGRWRC